jgi:Fe-S-cluster-containing dehydrogenase component
VEKYALRIDDAACWGCKTCEVACKQEMDAPDGVKLIEVLEDPPCAEACSAEAIRKRDDGIVVLDDQLCTGCQTCLEACPYGVIAFDGERGVARKCNLCHHRVDKGLYPACADNVCLGHCIYFGEIWKIQDEITKKHQIWAKNQK